MQHHSFDLADLQRYVQDLLRPCLKVRNAAATKPRRAGIINREHSNNLEIKG